MADRSGNRNARAGIRGMAVAAAALTQLKQFAGDDPSANTSRSARRRNGLLRAGLMTYPIVEAMHHLQSIGGCQPLAAVPVHTQTPAG